VRSFLTVDSFTSNVVDAVGAGDALLAYACLSLARGGSPVTASILGSVAAAIACERDGNQPISPEEVLKKLQKLQKQTQYE
jgi:sugar/nucleoside kinase (ribokinase family)